MIVFDLRIGTQKLYPVTKEHRQGQVFHSAKRLKLRSKLLSKTIRGFFSDREAVAVVRCVYAFTTHR